VAGSTNRIGRMSLISPLLASRLRQCPMRSAHRLLGRGVLLLLATVGPIAHAATEPPVEVKVIRFYQLSDPGDPTTNG